jgi:hypothetical protein
LENRLNALKHVPLQAFCQNVRKHDFLPRYAQADACSIEQYQFLKLVVFFSYEPNRKSESPTYKPNHRTDTMLKRESTEAVRRYASDTGTAVPKVQNSRNHSLPTLLEMRDRLHDKIYELSEADVRHVTGMRADAAKKYIDEKIEKREQRYLPLNRDYVGDVRESKKKFANMSDREAVDNDLFNMSSDASRIAKPNKAYNPDMENVQIQIMRDYMGLLTQPFNYKGAFMCDQLGKLMGPSVRGWRVVRYLGGGVFGKVFQMQAPGGTVVAVKFMVEEKQGEAAGEVRAQTAFHALGLAPRVLEHKTIKTQGGVKMHLIVMDRIDLTLEEMLCMAQHDTGKIRKIADQVVNMMARMRTARVTHGDMHIQNIGYTIRNGEYVPILIDFGQSSTKSNNPLVDSEQLLRTLTSRDLHGAYYPYAYIIADALQKYIDRIGLRYQLTGDDETQGEIWHNYMAERDVLSDSKRRRFVESLSDIVDMEKSRGRETSKGRKKSRRKKSRGRKTSRRKKSRGLDLIHQLM